jgi:hypothetical protein
MPQWMIRTIACIMVVIAIRGGTLLAMRQRLDADPDSYALLAEGITHDGTFGFVQADGTVRATAFRPPFYSWLLSWCCREGKLDRTIVVWLHALLVIIGLLAVLDIARRLKVSIWIAAIFFACDPVLIDQQSLVMTETLAATLFASLWWSFIQWFDARGSRRWWWGLALGCVMGLGHLTRPVFTPCALLLVVLHGAATAYTEIARRRRTSRGGIEKDGPLKDGHLQDDRAHGWRTAVGSWLVMVIAFVLVIAAWTRRNQQQLGQPIWATTHGGYTLLLANNPLLFDHVERSSWWDRKPWDAAPFHAAWCERASGDLSDSSYWFEPHQIGCDAVPPSWGEVEDDRRASEAGRATIARAPRTFVSACLERLYWLWSPWPQRTGFLRHAVALWYLLLYALVSYTLVFHGLARIADTRRAAAAQGRANRAGAARVGRHRFEFDRRWVPAIAMALALTSVHAIYWSNARMRAPAIPALAILAAAAIGAASKRITSTTTLHLSSAPNAVKPS